MAEVRGRRSEVGSQRKAKDRLRLDAYVNLGGITQIKLCYTSFGTSLLVSSSV
jgi:hypothetical protein